MKPQLSRRKLLQASALSCVGFVHGSSTRRISAAQSANEKLNVACIGVGGRGSANVKGLSGENLVAFVDVDEQRAAGSFKAYPKVQRFTDYRRMLDSIGKDLDGVAVSTPDHTHFHPSLAAMQMGLHVYLEKPLAHNVWETRTLTDLAKSKGLATQLGAQRHALSNMHRVVELIQSGAIGKVNEVHCWVGGSRGMPSVPKDSQPVPASLNYDLWVGPAKFRPYHSSFCPYGWRFWWDFGTGETGNWGCHILDIPYWALGLKYPSRVDASGPDIDAERTPKSMKVQFSFADSNQNKPVELHWYHGVPDDVLKQHGLSAKGNNTLFIGDDGMLLAGFGQRKLYPEKDFADFQAPDPFIPDSPGFHKEWINACKGGEAATCDFDYSGPLAETVLLGNVAYRSGGGFDWDAKTLTAKGNAKAQSYIRESYRKGWEVASVS